MRFLAPETIMHPLCLIGLISWIFLNYKQYDFVFGISLVITKMCFIYSAAVQQLPLKISDCGH